MAKVKGKMMVTGDEKSRTAIFGNRDLLKCPVSITQKVLKTGRFAAVRVAGEWLGGSGFWVSLAGVKDSVLFRPAWLKTQKDGPLVLNENQKTLVRRVLNLPDAFPVEISFINPKSLVEELAQKRAAPKFQTFQKTPLFFTFDGRQNVAFKCKETGELRAVDNRMVEAFGITVLFGFEGGHKFWMADDPKPENASLWLYSRPGVEDDSAFSILDIVTSGSVEK